MGYQGWVLFMDCDMLCRADIKALWDQRDDRYGAMCVQHEHFGGDREVPRGGAERLSEEELEFVDAAELWSLQQTHCGLLEYGHRLRAASLSLAGGRP